MVWKPLLPSPGAPQSWVIELVVGNRAVHTGTRIPVPVPHAAVITTAFEQLSIVTQISEALQLVYTSEPSSNNKSIEFLNIIRPGPHYDAIRSSISHRSMQYVCVMKRA